MKKEEVSTAPPPRFRPPDFLLPQSEGSSGRRRAGPDIYVTWDGEVYGPSIAEDILAGLRASSFKPNAQFWFEGQEDWQPITTFKEIVEFSREAPVVHPPPPAITPSPPPAASAPPVERRRRDRHRRSRPFKASKLGRRRRWVVVSATILAALLTVGLLSLLMLI